MQIDCIGAHLVVGHRWMCQVWAKLDSTELANYLLKLVWVESSRVEEPNRPVLLHLAPVQSAANESLDAFKQTFRLFRLPTQIQTILAAKPEHDQLGSVVAWRKLLEFGLFWAELGQPELQPNRARFVRKNQQPGNKRPNFCSCKLA